MSVVKKIITENPAKWSLEIDNGDLQALREVIEKYKFKNEEALLRFIMFVLLKAEKNAVYIDEGEKTVALTPARHLLKD
jgi:hypothetical protein